MAHALGIDLGTTNVKVALVGDDGEIAAAGHHPLRFDRRGREAEQDAEALWQAVGVAVRQATAAAPDAAGEVRALTVCSQYSSLVPVDERGLPVGPMLLYLDTRGTGACWAIMERHPEAMATFIERHGIPPIGGGLSLGHLLHLQDQAAIHEVTAAYLEPMDYLGARLTGRLAATQCTSFMLQLCDNRAVGTTAYDDELLRLAGVDASRLPPLIAVDGVVGEVLPAVAAALGLPPGVTVHAAMNDSQAGALAAGALDDGVVGLAVGTTAVLLDTVDEQRVDLARELVSMPSPHDGRYLVWAENGIAGKAVEHVLDQVLLADDALGLHRSADPFAHLEEALAGSGPGPSDVLFLPWLTGSLAPAADGRVRGGFLNLSLDTRRVDLVRSMVEGTAHNVAWLLPSVEAFTGRRAEVLHFYGGAARSVGWARILADVTGRPVRAALDPDHVVARSMALVGLQRSGHLSRADVDALRRFGAVVEPDADRHQRYQQRQVDFEEAFAVLRPLYERRNG